MIAYTSRTLNLYKKNYLITELEYLVVIWFIKYFYHYLHEQKFTIITNHSALTYLKNIANPTR